MPTTDLKTYKFKACHRCGADEWIGIPDSLARACTKCGAVLVGEGPDDAEPGKSLQEWAADLYADAAQNASRPDGAAGEGDGG